MMIFIFNFSLCEQPSPLDIHTGYWVSVLVWSTFHDSVLVYVRRASMHTYHLNSNKKINSLLVFNWLHRNSILSVCVRECRLSQEMRLHKKVKVLCHYSMKYEATVFFPSYLSKGAIFCLIYNFLFQSL